MLSLSVSCIASGDLSWMIRYFVEYIEVRDIGVDGRNNLIYFVPFIHVSVNSTIAQACYISLGPCRE